MDIRGRDLCVVTSSRDADPAAGRHSKRLRFGIVRDFRRLVYGQAETARQKHIAEMKDLAAREEQTWKKVEDLLDNGRKIASVYDEATGLLVKLQQLSEFQDMRSVFQQRLRRLAGKYSARSALMGRWRTKGWIE